MADLLDDLLSGVPNAPSGTPQIFGKNAVSRSAARGIVSDRISRSHYLLDSRAKIEDLRTRERAQAQGKAVLGQLTGLDPLNDPDYLGKVQGILSQNPEATLDAAVANFLQIQQGAFNRVDQDRQREAEETRQRQLQEERDRRQSELAEERTRTELQIRREAALQAELDQLPPSLVERFSGYRDFGFSPFEAMAKVKEDAATAGALSELAELGISPDDPRVRGVVDPDDSSKILVPGVFDSQGRVDAGRVNTLKAQAQADKVRAKDQEILKRDARANISVLQKLLLDPELSDARREEIQTSLDKYLRLAGIDAPLTEEAESGSVLRGDSRLTPPPDTSPADRFIPR